MTVMPKLFVIIPRDHLRVAVQKVIRGTVGIAQVRFIDIHRDILIIMKYFHSIISNGLWRFTKPCLALSPDCIEQFTIFKGNFCEYPHFKSSGCRVPNAADTGCYALEFGEYHSVGIDNTS